MAKAIELVKEELWVCEDCGDIAKTCFVKVADLDGDFEDMPEYGVSVACGQHICEDCYEEED